MLRFGETKVANEKLYAAEKPIKFCGVNIDNIAITNETIETKINFNYLIGYLDKVIRP